MSVQARSPATPYQKAIFAKLDAALAVGVYDHVPDGTDPPYVVIGQDTWFPLITKTKIHWIGESDIEIWSEGLGRKEAKDLAATIIQTLTAPSALDLSADNYKVLFVEFDEESSLLESPGDVRHEILSFKAHIADIS